MSQTITQSLPSLINDDMIWYDNYKIFDDGFWDDDGSSISIRAGVKHIEGDMNPNWMSYSPTWFVASDVAKALGYRDAYNLTRILDPWEKDSHAVNTLGGIQNMTIISEEGLNHAIFKSTLPTARRFRRWVYREVLPAIRKFGGYMTIPFMEQLRNRPDTIDFYTNRMAQFEEYRMPRHKQMCHIVDNSQPWADVRDQLLSERQRFELECINADLQYENLMLKSQLANDMETMSYCNSIVDGIGPMRVDEFAKYLSGLEIQPPIDIGRNKLYAWMREHGYLMQNPAYHNRPQQKAINAGWLEFHKAPHVPEHITITTKGAAHIFNELYQEVCAEAINTISSISNA